MNIKEILLDIDDLFLDIKDDGFNVILSKEELEAHIKYEYFISYKKEFTIDMIDPTLFRTNDYLKKTQIPYGFHIWLSGVGLKKVHLYNDDRYIRYDGIKLRDWNLIKYIKLILLIKK